LEELDFQLTNSINSDAIRALSVQAGSRTILALRCCQTREDEQFDEEINLKIRSPDFCIGLQAKYTDARLVYLWLYSPLLDLGRFSVS
jgi:hypothetical protein